MMAAPTDLGIRPIRIANCSGFYGDRLSAAQEMVEQGPIDVLTGDYLAELTMLILHKARRRDPATGFATTFVRQVEDVLGACIERGIRIVTNAGGLNPAGCADAVRLVAGRLGLQVDVAHIEGDDLLGEIDRLRPQLDHTDTGQPLEASPITANAYLGGWGIAAALTAGAQVVVCPRVTDAALVVGPAAWWWDWKRDDWDALAGAVTAGHVIECGAQVTGGNFSFFADLADRARPLGFPIAEVGSDGSSVITKHPGTGGAVTVDTVTAQLVYEIGGPRYANPDVVARFDTVQLTAHGPDRIAISGVRGEPAPPSTKVCINIDGGYRNRVSFVLTGLHQQEKADLVNEALFQRLGGQDVFDEVDVRFVSAPSNATTHEQSSGRLHISVRSSDERLVGRAFSSAAVELALATYPGFFTTTSPGAAQSIGDFWPALVANEEIHQQVVLSSGHRIDIDSAPHAHPRILIVPGLTDASVVPVGPGPTEPLGSLFGARSGDKGGNANVGIWARDNAGYAWLVRHLDADMIQLLIPEAHGLVVQRFEFPSIRAINFVIVGYLGRGVASNTVFDPQAKGLGEYLLSRVLPTGNDGTLGEATTAADSPIRER